jgi:uncharacterized protein YfaS (alpha-2-macroglobulin family)
MNPYKQIFCVFLIGCWLVVPGCKKAPQQVEPGLDLSMVTAHSSGTISRESPIRVRFAEDLMDSSQVNIALERSPFSFNPEISGMALWSDPRTLEFRPHQRLPGGVQYAAEMKISDFMETEPGKDVFRFEFSTMRQSFEITVNGLQSIPRRDPKEQQLSGDIVTADVDNEPDIQKLVAASQEGRYLTVRWIHHDNRREHSFVVEGIVRGENPSEVKIRWDGGPVGVDKKGEQIVPVPALSTFAVLQARAVQEEEEYVEIRFSDPLDARQDLRGLIQIDRRADLRFTIEQNIIRTFSPAPWAGRSTVTVNPGIRSAKGYRLPNGRVMEVVFQEILPQVRFSGKGVIIPTTQGLTIPIETINLRAVVVKATRIYEKNIPQFLQVNELNEDNELNRVGRIIWEKTIPLGFTPDQKNRWMRYGLDVSPLVEENPDGLYRLHLTFRRPHIVYRCSGPGGAESPAEGEPQSVSWDEEQESSYWDAWEAGFNRRDYYDNRKNPCHPAYYRRYYDHDINVFRNILVSDLGLIAKRGNDGSLFVAVTDIKTTAPVPGVDLTLLDYQHQVLGRVQTDGEGTARLTSEHTPYLLTARSGLHSGYLKLDDGSSLSVSQFDVAGTTVTQGLKGFIYGERGVWRPGDPIYLTFILLNGDHRIPEEYPVNLELRNPRGQLVETITRKRSINGFYTFQLDTDPDAPTGNWNARIKAGGAVFEKILKIETVMPNRLKIKVDFGKDIQSLSGGRINGTLSAAWLHGAVARNLKSDMEMTLTAAQTRFPKFDEYAFDDPVRRFSPESQTILKGTLDETGNTPFSSDIRVENVSPGMLTATFTTRVFEPGGAFSIDRMSLPYHPFERYIGIRTPKGDKARGMLLTDTKHPVHIVALDPLGRALPNGQAKVEVYKIKWRWWWERGRESLADYIGTQEYRPIQTATVDLPDGTGSWELEIKYPDWGRYLIRVSDRKGSHIAGKIVYIDWPGWAGRAQKDMPGGAAVLSFASDKEEYQVGENVVLTIPTGRKGRGLVSLETGTKVLQTAWIETGEEAARFTFTATNVMAPNIYAHVTMLQPHLQAGNDLPIRMYGVIPIKIMDPGTRLSPVIKAPEVFKPEAEAQISIREQNGNPMTYTVAIVDEGLLDLTRFATPDPWTHFYQREALGVKTWDLFDQIAGAYGGRLEQLLAVGGGEEAGPAGQKRATRFPPLVRFLGPFGLERGQENTHRFQIPQYVGSVRIMVAAGQDRAFGHTDQAVFVRKPLMILGTLPRVLGPEEEVDLPVAVFALDKDVRDVAVEVQSGGPVAVVGPARKQITFAEPGEDLVSFRLKAEAQTGIAAIHLNASGGGERAGHKIELDVKPPTSRVVDVVNKALAGGESWRQEISLPGLSGTNQALLEVSRIPPIDLGRRLDFLIRYPHGCVEQVTSSVFPQLYINQLIELAPDRQDEIQENVTAGIDRLRMFQSVNGGFLYWPGASDADEWASNYAGHFLVEAQKVGYLIPPGILDQWKKYQRGKALSWVKGERRSELMQAYRLYTLALSGTAELGAMNRLKEMPGLPAEARWRLAAAYQLAGQPEAAQQMVRNVTVEIPEYRELSYTFGSSLRDKAMVLEALGIMNMMDKAIPLAREISEQLSSDRWLSTQTTAYALIAMARISASQQGEMRFAYSWAGGEERIITSELPIVQNSLPVEGRAQGTITVSNEGDVMLYARLILQGVPRPGEERPSQNGLAIRVRYFTLDNQELDPAELEQGTDFIAEVTVSNIGLQGEYQEVALSHPVPSGWEIRNLRMAPTGLIQDSGFEYQDIRDDRVYTYFDIRQGESKVFHLLLNASYLGKYYLPFISAEAMYDATITALVPGRRITVRNPGETRREGP